MTNKNKIRGDVLEREVVKAWREQGFEAERARGSDGRSLGHHQEVDVVVNGLTVQCKRRKRIAEWLTCANSDIVCVREDRGQRLYVIPEDVLFRILKGE